MVVICSAPGCTSKKDSTNSKSSVQFHRFPLRKPDLLAKWVKAMKNPNFRPTVTSYLCSAHFSASDYDSKPTAAGKHLKPNAVPVIYEKKRPGRKKKITVESETTPEIKDNDDEYAEGKDSNEVNEEYLEVNTNEKVESNLAEIIGDQEKGTLHVLIVDEDGKITNSEYIFKKEVFPDYDIKEEPDEGVEEVYNNVELVDLDEDDDEVMGEKTESNQEEESSALVIARYKEKIKKLESSLFSSTKKVRLLQMKCGRMNKKINELKLLLKLLVLKRGRGEKNLIELLEEYEKLESEEMKMEVKEEDCDF